MKAFSQNQQIFNLILDKSVSSRLFEKILTENTDFNTVLFESIIREEREHLREMAQLQIKQGIIHIINLIKSGIDSIKQRFTFLLTNGGEEGTFFIDKNGCNISAEQWFSIILEIVKNTQVNDITYKNKKCTYMQVPGYKKRIEIIEAQYPKIIAFARKNGWSEGKDLSKKQLNELRIKMINELNLSSIK